MPQLFNRTPQIVRDFYNPPRRKITGRRTRVDNLGLIPPQRRATDSPLISPPVAGNDGASILPQVIYQKRQGAEAKSEGDYAMTKQAIDDAYAKGRMSDEEYNQLQADAFESTRTQYANLKRRTMESGYGRVNTGALRGELQGVDIGEIGALSRGRRDINMERFNRRAGASRYKASAYGDLMTRRQIPYVGIPQGFNPQQTATALTGQVGRSGYNPMLQNRDNVSYDRRVRRRRPRTDLPEGQGAVGYR